MSAFPVEGFKSQAQLKLVLLPTIYPSQNFSFRPCVKRLIYVAGSSTLPRAQTRTTDTDTRTDKVTAATSSTSLYDNVGATQTGSTQGNGEQAISYGKRSATKIRALRHQFSSVRFVKTFDLMSLLCSSFAEVESS